MEQIKQTIRSSITWILTKIISLIANILIYIVNMEIMKVTINGKTYTNILILNIHISMNYLNPMEIFGYRFWKITDIRRDTSVTILDRKPNLNRYIYNIESTQHLNNLLAKVKELLPGVMKYIPGFS